MKEKTITIKSILNEIVITSVGIGVILFLLKIGVVDEFLRYVETLGLLGIFIVGLFFTSVFTATPAALILALMSKTTPIALVAALGSLGSMVGDLIIFLFIRKTVITNTDSLLKKTQYSRFLSLTHLGFVRWIGAVVGAFVIISPLPDELALAIMGFFKIQPRYIIAISFVMNFFLIYGLGLAAITYIQ